MLSVVHEPVSANCVLSWPLAPIGGLHDKGEYLTS
jgi:hypothetical protein